MKSYTFQRKNGIKHEKEFNWNVSMRIFIFVTSNIVDQINEILQGINGLCDFLRMLHQLLPQSRRQCDSLFAGQQVAILVVEFTNIDERLAPESTNGDLLIVVQLPALLGIFAAGFSHLLGWTALSTK